LHGQDHSRWLEWAGQQMTDQSRCDVVRDVGNHQVSVLTHQNSRVEFEHIPGDDFDVGISRRHFFENGDQFLVDLNRGDVLGGLGQGAGEAAQPGADLQNPVRAGDCSARYDLPDHTVVEKEILPQPLVWIKVMLAKQGSDV
jgi:hypothetical protein